MADFEQHHQEALQHVERALDAERDGDERTARSAREEAFYAEAEAALALDDETSEPTRSLIYRSAATLAIDCGASPAQTRAMF